MKTGIRIRELKTWKREVIESLILFFVLGPLSLLLTCTGCWTSFEMAIVSSAFSGYFWVALWKGNAHGACWLDKVISWVDYPLKRLFAGLAFILVYTSVVAAVGYYMFFTLYLGRDFYDSFFGRPSASLLGPIVVTLLISAFMHGRGFFYSWREAAVNVEKLKREQLSSGYESLKNQVNPHFLFNSLNALTSLVHRDADMAERFIKKLSDVYRYVLDSQEKEVVDLKDELEFTEAYVFLQKIRHGDNLTVDINVTESCLMQQVPPLAVQMLIENAIKHNIVSQKRPLSIQVTDKEDSLVVTNDLQLRSGVENTTGLGLNNIKSRYEYLSNQSISIDKTEDKFIARIPLLSFAE